MIGLIVSIAFFLSHLKVHTVFSMFDVDKLARLSSIYHADFSNDDLATIRGQLENYIHHVRIRSSFFYMHKS
jgi:hypothetical protein